MSTMPPQSDLSSSPFILGLAVKSKDAVSQERIYHFESLAPQAPSVFRLIGENRALDPQKVNVSSSHTLTEDKVIAQAERSGLISTVADKLVHGGGLPQTPRKTSQDGLLVDSELLGHSNISSSSTTSAGSTQEGSVFPVESESEDASDSDEEPVAGAIPIIRQNSARSTVNDSPYGQSMPQAYVKPGRFTFEQRGFLPPAVKTNRSLSTGALPDPKPNLVRKDPPAQIDEGLFEFEY